MKMSIISICTSGLLVFVMSGCNDMESLKQKIRISSDRVVVEVAGRPQALGSDSIALRFERFAATSNFVASCEIENIPKVANEFILYLCVPLNANFELLNSSTVSTKMSDSDGLNYWRVDSPLSAWRFTETESERRYFYMGLGDSDQACSFVSDKRKKYFLDIKYNAAAQSDELAANLYFLLKSGGFK